MKAVWYARQGPAREVLQFGEQPLPEPGPGELRVRLAASAVNPSDCNRRAGKDYAMESPLIIPNSDGAGTVDLLGDGVDRGWLGRRVWLYNGQRGRALGTAAEYIALDASLVAPLPDDVGFAEGACLGIPCMTAYRCVFLDGEVEGKWVLVTGGAGAVGHYAIQLAKWGGARVIATASSETKAAHARAGGADHVIDYRSENVGARVLEITGGTGVDRIVEVDFGGNLEATLNCVALNGAIAAYASRGEAAPRLPFYRLMRKNVTLQAVLLYNTPAEFRRRAQREINRWLRSGQAKHTVAATYALRETAAAHEAVESGGKIGTVVVRCDV
jgi:NADPH2:quinone reductase